MDSTISSITTPDDTRRRRQTYDTTRRNDRDGRVGEAGASIEKTHRDGRCFVKHFLFVFHFSVAFHLSHMIFSSRAASCELSSR